MFHGSLVAIVTPFKKGKVDEKALGDLIDWQIAQGTHGIRKRSAIEAGPAVGQTREAIAGAHPVIMAQWLPSTFA